MKLNLSDNKVISLLLVALVLQILLLLWHMGLLGSLSQNETTQQGEAVGAIQIIENSMKRRPIDSLIWEDSRALENIYYYDSLLTLPESTAKIELKNGTHINLSENTLITIEPEAEGKVGEIRIQMSQGNLNARNPYQRAVISDERTSVKIEADSDIELVKSEDGKVEILVNKGRADIVYQDQAFSVQQNEFMVLSDEGTQKDKMSEELVWSSNSLARVYTHESEGAVSISWKGSAHQLQIEKNGEVFKSIPLIKSQQSISIKLPLGQYQCFLRGDNGRTKNREVQIWKAPKIQLVLPRPRDRRKIGPIQFIWTPQKNLSAYELVLKGKDRTLRFPSSFNKIEEAVTLEDDFLWEVWGVDQKGFKVPPAYNYPLYIRENPFAPPKLKKPMLIKRPKSASLQWWTPFFISSAWAQTKPEALFSWEPVPGAEVYFIEIGKDKEFRNPIVKEKLSQPIYRWKGFVENETYYWRVAAGDQSGRMGVFSEPALVDWDYVLPAKPRPEPKPRQTVKRPVAKKNPPPPPPTPSQAPVVTRKKPAPKAVEDLGPREYFKSLSLFYLPSYGLKNYKQGGQTKANLVGINPISLGLELELFITRGSTLSLYSKYNQVEYEPQPKSEFPFQPDLQTRTWVNHLRWSANDSSWGFGLILADYPSIQRQSFEEIAIQQKTAYGLLVEKSLDLGVGHWISNISLLSASSEWGIGTSQRFLFPLFFESLRVGAELEGFYIGTGEDQDVVGDFYIILGWQF